MRSRMGFVHASSCARVQLVCPPMRPLVCPLVGPLLLLRLLLLDDDHFESDRRELAVPQLQIEPLGQSASEWQLAAAEAMMTAKGSRLFRFVGHPIFAPDGEAWVGVARVRNSFASLFGRSGLRRVVCTEL